MVELNFKIVRDSELDSLLPEWEHLSESLPGPAFFASPLWQVNYWRCRSVAGPRPLVIAAFAEDASLVGVVPVARLDRERHNLVRPLRMSTGTGEYASYWCCHPSYADAFVAGLYQVFDREFRLWSKLAVNYLPSSSAVRIAWLSFCDSNRIPIEVEVADSVPIIRVDDIGGEARDLLAPKYAKEIVRKTRSLEKYGPIEALAVRQPYELDQYFDEFLQIEASGWKAQDGGAIALQPDALQFWKSVAYGAAEKGCLRLHLLSCGGRWIAAEMGVVWGETFHCLKIAYNEEFRNFAPGIMMTLEALQESLHDPQVKVYDRCGEIPHMLKAAAENYSTQRLVIAPRNPILRGYFVSRRFLKRVTRRYRLDPSDQVSRGGGATRPVPPAGESS